MALPLSKPVGDWPLLLCGPILRRVTPTSVAVFVALKRRSEVVLEIYQKINPAPTDTPNQSIAHETVALGKNLHVCVVEWRSQTPLAVNQIYGYDVSIRDPASSPQTIQRLAQLTPNALTGPNKLGYDEGALPSFSLPSDLKSLKVVHGSCRKAHAPGPDALAMLDDLIKSTFSLPSERPHHLLLTGDQIYADDVAVSLGATLRATVPDLLGWQAEEKLPRKASGAPLPIGDPLVAPGEKRGAFIKTETTISTALNENEKDLADGHLMFLGEFYAMYLFAWSDALWPASTGQTPKIRLPDAADLQITGTYQAKVDAARTLAHDFASTLPKVRRALANVPTSMMLDDHEITDDWYLHRKWTADARASAPTHRIIRNALLAYAVFQDWGNHPENYLPTTLGKSLLGAVGLGTGDSPSISGQPAMADAILDLQPTRTPFGQRMRWDWVHPGVVGEYQIVSLDTRTWRAFPAADRGAAALIESDPTKTNAQLAAAATTVPLGFQLLAHVPADNRVTIVISPAPLIGHPLAELIQKAAVLRGEEAPAILEEKIVGQTAKVNAILADTQPQPEHDEALFWARRELDDLKKDLAKAKVGAEGAALEYDSEAWSSNRIAYEDVLRRLAAFKRVVVLSGDVHYAFSCHVAYFRTGTTPPVPARIVQLCSSALKNETELTRQLGASGYDTIPATISWLGFDRDMAALKAGVKVALDTGLGNLATEDPHAHAISVTFFQFEMNDRFAKPAVIPTGHYFNQAVFERIRDAARDSSQQDLTDWRYTIAYIQDPTAESLRPADPAAVQTLLNPSPSFAHYKRMMIGSGRAVVGFNNIGRVDFSAVSGTEVNRVTHTICFQVPIAGQTATQTQMYTQHTAPLDLPGVGRIPEVSK